MTMKYKTLLFFQLCWLWSTNLMAASFSVMMSELNFAEILPITGTCVMDLNGVVTDDLGSQMCISSKNATIAHYRIIAPANTDISIKVNTRNPENGDGLTFTPLGKITSDVDDIDIVAGQTYIVSSGLLGRIDIKFGGQIIISNPYAFAANTAFRIDMEKTIEWSEVP